MPPRSKLAQVAAAYQENLARVQEQGDAECGPGEHPGRDGEPGFQERAEDAHRRVLAVLTYLRTA